jgi:protein-tyrosine phosphatase
MAEGLLRDRLARLGVDARVHSAGLLFDDHRASDDAVAVLADRGIDIADHRSSKIAADRVLGADLVLGLTREHVREVALLAPAALSKAFTLKELVRRGEAVGARMPGESIATWLSRAVTGRSRADILGSSDDDDVADPIGRPRDFYEATLAELTDLVDRLVSLVFAADAGAAARESA